jgi:hypothetical protein
MKYIAFDSANATGYAYKSGEIWVTGILDMTGKTFKKRLDQWRETIRLLAAAKAAGCTVAVVEDCYHAQGMKTFKSLVGTSTRLSVACEFSGLPAILIYPSEWQASAGITGQRKERKEKSIRLAKMLGANCVTEDESDARAVWYCARERM